MRTCEGVRFGKGPEAWQGRVAAPTMRRTIREYRLTEDARLEVSRRRVTKSDVARVLAAPEQAERVRQGRRNSDHERSGANRPKPIFCAHT